MNKDKTESIKTKWKNIAIVFIVSTVILAIFSGILFANTNYSTRIATKLGFIRGGYNQTAREKYLLKSWSDSLDNCDAEVVFLGDSITYGGDWAAYFPELSVCKLAVPGESVEQILLRADMVDKLNPQKVFLLVGINNISRRRYEATITENYEKLLKQLKLYHCEIYVQSILPVREPSKVSNSRINTVNQNIEALAKKYECIYVDIHSAFSDENGQMKKSLTKDGVHLNDEGYKVWVEQIREFVE